MADSDASNRTVNKHRQLICAIYGYASQDATFGLANNPAARADRRPEPERARLDFYRPHEIEQLAAALEAGAHRDPGAPAVGAEELAARAAEDRQDAELVRLAAYTGLRRRELVALRWRDVDFDGRKVVVRRAVSANVEAASTKSRRAREVPLPDQAADALMRLASRDDFTESDDYVFANRLGRRLDGSALRRRFERARDAAVCGRFDSTIFGTPTDRSSSPAASTSHRSSQRWATPGSPRLSATCMLGRRAN